MKLSALQSADRRLYIILLIVFVQMVGAAMVLPILPIYAKTRFGMSPETITLLITIFFAAQFVAGPFIGRLSDRYGRVPILIISQVGTVISFVMLGMAQSVMVLFLARLLDGITGGNIVVAQAYITDITSPKQRTQALGFIMAAFGMGFMIGPAIGGVLASALGDQMPYYVAAAAAAVTVVLTWMILDETVTPEKQAASQQHSRPRLGIQDVIRNKALVALLVIVYGSQIGMAMLQATFALYGEAVIFKGEPTDVVQLGIGLLLATVGLGQIFTQLVLVKRIGQRFGDDMLVIVGGVFRSASMLVMIAVASPISAGAGIFLFAIGTGLQLPALQSLTTQVVDDSLRGGVLGVYQSVNSFAIISGSAIAGLLFAVGPRMPYLLSALLFAIMVVPAYIVMTWRRQPGISQSAA